MHKECSGHKKTQNYVSELKFINMMCILDDVDSKWNNGKSILKGMTVHFSSVFHFQFTAADVLWGV